MQFLKNFNLHAIAVTLLHQNSKRLNGGFVQHFPRVPSASQLVPQRIPCRLSCNIRGFHTSPRRDLHPVIWLILKPILNISAALTGRRARIWYRGLDPKEKKSFWATIRANWPVFAGLALSACGLGGMYYKSHIQETPLTGRKRFVALTHDQLKLIAETEAASMYDLYKDKYYGENDIQFLRVLDVMARLAHANPELINDKKFEKWLIYVIKDDTVNACILPTGHVFVFEGMLKMAATQDQLAVVLGHEMAHALLEHGVEELSYAQLIDYVIIVLMAAVWCIIPSDGISFITHWFHKKVINLFLHLPHSRTIETEADKVGTMWAAKACYDVRQGSILWNKMDKMSKIQKDAMVPEWMSTHPDSTKRADYIDFLVPQAEKWRDEMQCPSWPSQDPRKAMEIIFQKVDNYITAQKAGQNLRNVPVKPGFGLQFPKPGLIQNPKLHIPQPSIAAPQTSTKNNRNEDQIRVENQSNEPAGKNE